MRSLTEKQDFPKVGKVLPKNIPQGYELMTTKWSFPRERIGETVLLNGEKVKKMLTLDVNIPERTFASGINSLLEGEAPIKEVQKRLRSSYPCIHKCKGCFNEASVENPVMTVEEIFDIITQAKELGLESIKFLGPGELPMHRDFFKILDKLKKIDIQIGIFTKGAIFGNDELSKHFHGMNSLEFTKKVYEYENVSFYVGARSFNEELENKLIPQNKKVFKEKFNYHKARNLCIERLCDLGANKDLFNQRIAIIASPITAENINYAYDMYVWSTERNMPIYLPPTMVSGKGHKLKKTASEKQFEDDYINLAAKIYSYAIRRGILTLEKLQQDGIHPYIGIAPCNQITHGMYIHYDGQVWQCPGNDTPNYIIHEDARKLPLVTIWKNSRNYKVNAYNNGCVKNGFSIPHRFYKETYKKVVEMNQ